MISDFLPLFGLPGHGSTKQPKGQRCLAGRDQLFKDKGGGRNKLDFQASILGHNWIGKTTARLLGKKVGYGYTLPRQASSRVKCNSRSSQPAARALLQRATSITGRMQ